MDLTGIMTLQRKLTGMERDLAAIQAKLKSLEDEAAKIQVGLLFNLLVYYFSNLFTLFVYFFPGQSSRRGRSCY